MVAGAPDVIRRFGILRDIGFGPCIHVARYGQSTVHQYDTADFVLDFPGLSSKPQQLFVIGPVGT